MQKDTTSKSPIDQLDTITRESFQRFLKRYEPGNVEKDELMTTSEICAILNENEEEFPDQRKIVSGCLESSGFVPIPLSNTLMWPVRRRN